MIAKTERSIHLSGEKVGSICVREVKVKQSPRGEATLEFGKEFWRVYWGLVGWGVDSAIPPHMPDEPFSYGKLSVISSS